jgi:methylamine dehydrogenase accessory protein MauD
MLGLEGGLSHLFWTSYVLLWLLLVVMGILVFLLYRQHGLMLMNTLDGVARDGPEVGSVAPPLSALGDEVAQVEESSASPRPTFVFFAAPECEPCRQIIPHINELPARLPVELGIVTVMAADSGPTLLKSKAPHVGRLILDTRRETFAIWDVRVTPFAVVVDTDRTVLSKGLCSNLAGLDSLVEEAGLLNADKGGELVVEMSGS